jgi:hypothetical protein
MNTNDELDARLLKADPAKNSNVKPVSEDLLTSAIKTKPKFALRQQFDLLTAKTKGFALGGLVSGAAAIVAVTLVINPTPEPLIQLAASQGGSENRSAIMSESSDEKMMIMPFTKYSYKAGAGLSNESGSGQVYKLVRTGDPESVLAKIAKVFEVKGSVKKNPDFSDQNPGYYFGESTDPWGVDNLNPMVSLWWSGTGSWNYYNPGDVTVSSSSCVEPDADGVCQEWTEVLPTPELLPTREDAIAKALEIFSATGLSVNESDLKIDYSEWGVYITAAMSVEGKPTSIEWYIGWSSAGEISFAGGHSVVAEAVGTFDTISAVQAVERLDDWRWFGSAATSFYDKYQGDLGGISVRNGETIEPARTEPEQPLEPEEITLTIVSAERALVSIWDASGDVWLVPGLILVNDQGWFNSIISVVDGVIALPDPSMVQIEPLPAEDSSVSN